MLYHYGPLQFSLVRGFALSLLLPVVVVVVLAIVDAAFLDSQSISLSMRTAYNQVASLYREYATVALLLHAIFFINTSLYRRRYTAYLPALFSLLYVSLAIWAVSSRLGLLPASLPNLDTDLLKSGIFSPTEPVPRLSDQAQTQPPFNPNPDVVVQHAVKGSTLRLAQDSNPNRLVANTRHNVGHVTLSQDLHGIHVSSGYLATAAVIFAINPHSAVSAAHDSYLLHAAGPCVPATYSMDGGNVSGCVAVVDEVVLGLLPIGKVRVFFTPSIHPSRVVLGRNALAKLSFYKETSGAMTVAIKRPAG